MREHLLKTSLMMSLIIFLIHVIPSHSSKAEELELHLESPKKDYIIREPIKFILTFKNVSQDTLRIIEMSLFQMWNSRHLYIEVVTPGGYVQYRQCKLVHISSILNYEYMGEPLPPGEVIQIFQYPNTSTTIAHRNSNHPSGEWGVTFAEPGTYRIRYIYYVQDKFRNLWKGLDGELYSNEIELTFREPFPSEKEIINAIWGGESDAGGDELSFGDESTSQAGDEISLRGVIDKYPNHPLIKYAYFYLGKLLANSKIDGKVMESIPFLMTLCDSFPLFRHEEVQLHFGWSLFCIGQQDRARNCFNLALKENPNLIHHYHFMQWKLFADTGDDKVFSAWRRNRRIISSTAKPGMPQIEE